MSARLMREIQGPGDRCLMGALPEVRVKAALQAKLTTYPDCMS